MFVLRIGLVLFLVGVARQRLWAPQTEPNVDVDLVAPPAPALPLGGCAEWCAAADSSAGRQRSCQEHCRAYPALQHHLGHLEAKGWAESVSAPAGSGITFACFYAQGDRGTEGFDAHQLARPNFNFVPILRRSNPGCNITLLTDQSTQFAGLPADVQVFRHPLDKARLGRNAWANYYQFRAQQAFLRRLERAGQARDVVFLDMDALVIAPMAPAFAPEAAASAPFDLALTLSDAVDMPINMGVQLVPRGRYPQAIAVLDAVCDKYPFNESFIAGQIALARYVGVLNQEAALLSHLAASVQRGRSCLALPVAGGGTGTVCLLPCHRWNYCHDDQSCCTSPQRLPLGLTAREHLERAGTAVLHQVGPRKKALDLLAAAYLIGGRGAAYEVFAGLAHNEEGMAAFDSAGAAARMGLAPSA